MAPVNSPSSQSVSLGHTSISASFSDAGDPLDRGTAPLGEMASGWSCRRAITRDSGREYATGPRSGRHNALVRRFVVFKLGQPLTVTDVNVVLCSHTPIIIGGFPFSSRRFSISACAISTTSSFSDFRAAFRCAVVEPEKIWNTGSSSLIAFTMRSLKQQPRAHRLLRAVWLSHLL
jgi:hypothetical protein